VWFSMVASGAVWVVSTGSLFGLVPPALFVSVRLAPFLFRFHRAAQETGSDNGLILHC
jgi:hypothetical protein